MQLAGNTQVLVNGKPSRILSSRFNAKLKAGKLDVKDAEGNPIVPSKGLTWLQVAQAIRSGKKVLCSSEGKKRARTPRKSKPEVQETV